MEETGKNGGESGDPYSREENRDTRRGEVHMTSATSHVQPKHELISLFPPPLDADAIVVTVVVVVAAVDGIAIGGGSGGGGGRGPLPPVRWCQN